MGGHSPSTSSERRARCPILSAEPERESACVTLDLCEGTKHRVSCAFENLEEGAVVEEKKSCNADLGIFLAGDHKQLIEAILSHLFSRSTDVDKAVDVGHKRSPQQRATFH